MCWANSDSQLSSEIRFPDLPNLRGSNLHHSQALTHRHLKLPLGLSPPPHSLTHSLTHTLSRTKLGLGPRVACGSVAAISKLLGKAREPFALAPSWLRGALAEGVPPFLHSSICLASFPRPPSITPTPSALNIQKESQLTTMMPIPAHIAAAWAQAQAQARALALALASLPHRDSLYISHQRSST